MLHNLFYYVTVNMCEERHSTTQLYVGIAQDILDCAAL